MLLPLLKKLSSVRRNKLIYLILNIVEILLYNKIIIRLFENDNDEKSKLHEIHTMYYYYYVSK